MNQDIEHNNEGNISKQDFLSYKHTNSEDSPKNELYYNKFVLKSNHSSKRSSFDKPKIQQGKNFILKDSVFLRQHSESPIHSHKKSSDNSILNYYQPNLLAHKNSSDDSGIDNDNRRNSHSSSFYEKRDVTEIENKYDSDICEIDLDEYTVIEKIESPFNEDTHDNNDDKDKKNKKSIKIEEETNGEILQSNINHEERYSGIKQVKDYGYPSMNTYQYQPEQRQTWHYNNHQIQPTQMNNMNMIPNTTPVYYQNNYWPYYYPSNYNLIQPNYSNPLYPQSSNRQVHPSLLVNKVEPSLDPSLQSETSKTSLSSCTVNNDNNNEKSKVGSKKNKKPKILEASVYIDKSNEELISKIASLYKDQNASKYLQEKIKENKRETVEWLFPALKPYLIKAINNQFGNYLIQALFPNMIHEELHEMIEMMKDTIMAHCIHENGTKAIMNFHRYLKTPALQENYINIIKPSLINLAKHQKGIKILLDLHSEYPHSFSSLNDIIIEKSFDLATDSYGFQLIIQILKQTKNGINEELHKGIIDKLLNCHDRTSLILDPNANYVIQELFQLSDLEAANKIAMIISERIVYYSKNTFSSNIVEKCLVSDIPTRPLFFSELSKPEAVNELLLNEKGNYVLQKLLLNIDKSKQDELKAIIVPLFPKLKKTNYGPKVISKLNDIFSVKEHKSLNESVSTTVFDDDNLKNNTSNTQKKTNDNKADKTKNKKNKKKNKTNNNNSKISNNGNSNLNINHQPYIPSNNNKQQNIGNSQVYMNLSNYQCDQMFHTTNHIMIVTNNDHYNKNNPKGNNSNSKFNQQQMYK